MCVMYACVYVFTRIYVIYVYMHYARNICNIYMDIYICIYIYICVCVCVCVCVRARSDYTEYRPVLYFPMLTSAVSRDGEWRLFRCP